MRVLHVTGVYPPASMSGPPEQTHRLARELRAAGVDARVVTTNAYCAETTNVPTDRWSELEGVPVYYGQRIPGTSEVSWTACREVAREARTADVIHATGLFSMLPLAVAAAARRHQVPVVVSPRGSLDRDALAFSAWKKSLYFRLGGYRALKDAAAFHVTSEMERAHVESFVPGAVTRIVQNGVEVPSDDELARWRVGAPLEATILYLGRIHPKKNVIPLVRAWALVTRRHPNARLVLAGPDDHGHRVEVERAIGEEALEASVSLPGRVVGEDKHRLLARATCLVLPSVTENFGNVVAEALARRVPAIASTGTPWSGLRDHACGWWLPPTIDELAGAIDRALSIDEATRAAMGARGRSWMIEEFTWPTVARAMRDLYDLAVSNRRIPR